MNNEDQLSLTIPNDLTPVIFTEAGKIDSLLQDITKKVHAFKADISTPSGRKEIASMAYAVARSKTALDDLGKELVSEWAFAYRQCTGACKTGIKIFIDSIENLKPSYTLIEIIENTKGQDGHEKFCEIVGVN